MMGRRGRKRRAARARQAAAKDRADAPIRAWRIETPVRSDDHGSTQIVLVVAGAVLILLVPRTQHPQLVMVVVALIVAVAALLKSLSAPPAKETQRQKVWLRATQEGLEIDGALVPRSQITGASISPGARPGRPVVVVERALEPPLELEVRGANAAHRIVRALAPAPAPPPPPITELTAPPESAPDPAPVRRRDRSTAAWIASLRALGEGIEAGPRTAPIPRDRLLRILEAPALPAIDRAAAAVALAVDADDGERERLRIAAEDAEPRLRVVLEQAAAEADEEALAAALEAIEAAER